MQNYQDNIFGSSSQSYTAFELSSCVISPPNKYDDEDNDNDSDNDAMIIVIIGFIGTIGP